MRPGKHCSFQLVLYEKSRATFEFLELFLQVTWLPVAANVWIARQFCMIKMTKHPWWFFIRKYKNILHINVPVKECYNLKLKILYLIKIGKTFEWFSYCSLTHLTFVTHVKDIERIVFFLFSKVQRVHKHVVLWLKQWWGNFSILKTFLKQKKNKNKKIAQIPIFKCMNIIYNCCYNLYFVWNSIAFASKP